MHYKQTINLYIKTIDDQQALIYIKYIVVRFLFSNKDNFKLEDVNFNIAPYNR